MEKQLGSSHENPAMENGIGPLFAVEPSNSLAEPAALMEILNPAPKILEPPGAAPLEVHRPPSSEELHASASMDFYHLPLMEEHSAAAPASVEELPAAALMEINLPPLTEGELSPAALTEIHHPTLMGENLAPAPAASMEVHPPSSTDELPAAATVHRPTLMEEHPAALTEIHHPSSMEELPAAALMEVPPAAAAAVAASTAALDVDDPNYLSSFPSGYRFQPYDHELIMDYLKPKIAGEKLPPNRIHEINLTSDNPESLAAKYEPGCEGEWYFFTSREKKYKNGQRPNRSAGDGYWKASGADTPILYREERVGSRKALVFYRGEHKYSEKTNWIMHEYVVFDPATKKESSVDSSDMKLDDWVLCRIFQKPENGPSRRQNYRRTSANNRLVAVQEANGDEDPWSPMEDQSRNGQGTIGPTKGQSNVQHHNSILIEVRGHSGQRNSRPTQGQYPSVQGARSPMAGQRRGKGILVEGQSHSGQEDNSPIEGQNVLMQEIRSPVNGKSKGKGTIVEGASHGEHRDSSPLDSPKAFIQRISSPMAGQANVNQSNGMFMEIQNHGGQTSDGPIESQIVSIQEINSPMEVQNLGGQRGNGPIEGQSNCWQETIMIPSSHGQVNSLDYPFNPLTPQLRTNYRQILPAHPNPPISHPDAQQIQGSNGTSCFNHAHQTLQFASQVPHQYGNQVSNWQAQSHNISEFYTPQIHQPRQQLISNNHTQQFHPNNSNHQMNPYRMPQNDINGALLGPSRIFGESEDLQCNYLLDYAFYDQLIYYDETYPSSNNKNETT